MMVNDDDDDDNDNDNYDNDDDDDNHFSYSHIFRNVSSSYRFYQQKFENYPKDRQALIPYIF